MNQDFTKNLRIVLDFLTASDPIESIPVCDAVFLFGSSKTELIPKSGSKLFKMGLVKKIVCTGKYSPYRTVGPFCFSTEAEWYADVLIKDGVPREAIITESESTNTLENVLFGMSACHEQQFYPNSLILCSIPLLCRRALATFQKQFPEITTFSYTLELTIENYLVPDRIRRIIGEFDRFKKYAEKGDMVSVEVPENVQKAVNFLKSTIHKT
ncbi:MAG: YdcF family protein [Patescibacteria group bacterium]